MEKPEVPRQKLADPAGKGSRRKEHIRPASMSDLDRLMEIYEIAKAYMRENGNPDQWNGTYPERELLAEDIKKGQLYVFGRIPIGIIEPCSICWKSMVLSDAALFI